MQPLPGFLHRRIIKDLQAGKAPAEKTIIMDEKGFDASTITQEDVDNYGI